MKPRFVRVLVAVVAMSAVASGLAAIAFLLRWLTNHPLDIFVWYRIVLATLISESLATSVANRAGAIITNAMPSIQTLSNARGDLRQLENDFERYAAAPADARGDLRTRIDATLQTVESNLVSYAALPFFPAERPLYTHARIDLDTLGARLAASWSSPDERHIASVHTAIDNFDQSIQRMITFDATQGQRLGREIQDIRARTRATALLLDALSVMLALFATGLAVRQLRRAARAEQADRIAREKRETELVSQNEALGQFAGRVAHDILSPLSAASLALDLARECCAQDTRALRVTERGSAAVRRVYTLVDGLLEFSRAGGRPEPGARTELAPVVTDVAAELGSQASQQDIALVVGDVPAGTVGCGEAVLTSLLSNLVRNSIKYMGDAKERRIELRIRELDTRWRFEVEDTGPGIPEAQQARIFEPYVQLDRAATGIGLGLATVERLVRAHRGSVGVISPAGGHAGALFWFELPKVS